MNTEISNTETAKVTKTPKESKQDQGQAGALSNINWFDIETKCQKLVYGIMQPAIQRQHTDRTNIERIQTQLETEIRKRLEDIEYFILRKKKDNAGFPTVFDLANERINKIEKDLKENVSELSQKFDDLSVKLEFAEHRVTKIEESTIGNNQRLEWFDQELRKCINQIHETAKGLVIKIDTNLQEQSVKIVDSIDTVRKMDVKLSEHTIKIAEHDTYVSMSAEKLNILHKEVTAMYRDLGSLENLKLDKSSAVNQFQELAGQNHKLLTMISMKENDISTIENFIEKYLPIRVLAQLSDILTAVYRNSESTEMQRLIKYERKKIGHFNEIILNDNGVPNIMKIISEVKFRINNVLSQKNQKDQGQMNKEMVKRASIVDENKIIEECSQSSSKDENCLVQFRNSTEFEEQKQNQCQTSMTNHDKNKDFKSQLQNQNLLPTQKQKNQGDRPKTVNTKAQNNYERLKTNARAAEKREVDYSIGLDHKNRLSQGDGISVPGNDLTQLDHRQQDLQLEMNMRNQSASPLKLKNSRLAQLKIAVVDNKAATTLPQSLFHLNEMADEIPMPLVSQQRLTNKSPQRQQVYAIQDSNGLNQETLQALNKQIKHLKDDVLELVRQDRVANHNEMIKIVKDSEQKIMLVIDGIRQNLFDIFNEITTPQKQDEQNHEFKSIRHEVERLKRQIKDVQTAKTIQSVQSTALVSPRTLVTAASSNRGTRRNIEVGLSSGSGSLPFRQFQVPMPKQHIHSTGVMLSSFGSQVSQNNI